MYQTFYHQLYFMGYEEQAIEMNIWLTTIQTSITLFLSILDFKTSACSIVNFF